MKKQIWAIMAVAWAVWLGNVLYSQDRPREDVDQAMISAIRDEGLAHSQVMDHVI
jgi:hypothetical protein